jgi:hypothetical protein
MAEFLIAVKYLIIGILVGGVGAVGYFMYTGSQLKFKR